MPMSSGNYMLNTKPTINVSHDVKFWRFAVFAILFLSILRGIRFPNIWSYSHFLLNYDLGFIKRGLIGEIISQFNNPYLASYEFFFVFSIAIFFINIILLWFLIRDFINSQNPILIGCSIVFASSLAVVFLSHTVGYFDHIGLLIALVTIKISGFYKKTLFVLLALPLALLVHEAFLVIYYPVIFMSLLLSLETEGRTKKLLILGALSAILLILVSVIANRTLEETEANEMYARLQAKIEHPLRQDAFNVLVRDSADNVQIMKSLLPDKRRLMGLVRSFMITSPAFLVFIYFTIVLMKKAKGKSLLTILSVLASVSPLLLHFIGRDMERWNTLTVTTSFLMLYIAYAIKKDQPVATSNYIYSILTLVVFLNGISSIPLFDGYYVKQFPFFEHKKYIIDAVYGKEIFPYVPPR